MAYVPWQCYGNLYSLPQALKNGTLFRELDLEFAARRCN
ncbi:MAG: spore coat associated protein CotJA [Lachnospiraceae bacterium]|nr:spore coat associated protein CotJA [Lachnospiraceae bacterium]MBP3609275.1 spore coat associated protein CotJA [Lachnospiraceae bacterium]